MSSRTSIRDPPLQFTTPILSESIFPACRQAGISKHYNSTPAPVTRNSFLILYHIRLLCPICRICLSLYYLSTIFLLSSLIRSTLGVSMEDYPSFFPKHTHPWKPYVFPTTLLLVSVILLCAAGIVIYRMYTLQEQIVITTHSYSGGQQAQTSGNTATIAGAMMDRLDLRVSLNTGSKEALIELSGIGEVTAQKIIDHRPYARLEEVVEKGVLRQSLYNTLKDVLTL